MVLVVADDPFMFSSQNEQDSRFYANLSGLPMLEPSTVAEAKEMAKYAFELSEELRLPVLLRTTTRINHSSGIVTLGSLCEMEIKGGFSKDPFNLVCIPAVSRKLHPRLLEKIGRAAGMADQSIWNRIEGDGKWGIICNGVSYGYVKDAIDELEETDRFRVLRIGFSYPFPEELTRQFLNGCEKVLVAEEGEPWLQETVHACAQRAGLTVSIRGKEDGPFSRLYEFDPIIVKT